MPDDREIERVLDELAAVTEFSQDIQRHIRVYATSGLSRESFDVAWRADLAKAGFADTEIEYLAPWINTWADEVFSNLEKENNK